MKIGIGLPNAVPGTGGTLLISWARRAEACGFDSLAVIDRVVYDSYDPLVTLATAAAVTERVELVTNVLIAPQHRTALLAKQAASLDRISGGRLMLGMGVGTRSDDFTACATPLTGRGARFDEQLAELRSIWAGEAGIGPAPARPGGPAVLIGGDATLAAPRVARYGIGWTMMVGTPEQFALAAGIVRTGWQRAGRHDHPRLMALTYAALGPTARESAARAIGDYYAWLGPDLAGWITRTAATDEAELAERITSFAAAGATDIVLIPCAPDLDQLDRFATVALSTPALA